jgi:NADPH:quinone reductase-like Zn-dependent oxidoreductase
MWSGFRNLESPISTSTPKYAGIQLLLPTMPPKVTRRCFRRHGHKSPQTLEAFTEEIELSGPKDILIRLHAVALNYRDVNILNGTNPWPVLPSGIPCSDAAGVVVETGKDVTKWVVGQRVSPIFDQNSITGLEQSREWLGGEVDGVLATHVIFPEDKIVEIPTHLTWAEAACLPCAGLTAWNALAYEGSLTSGKTVLVQGPYVYCRRFSAS